VRKLDEAIILCRISDEKQKDGYSLDAQERVGREYCKANGFNIAREPFRFVETGSKSQDRKKFDGMMQFIGDYVLKATRTLHLIVEKPDRLTRNFTNREQLQFFVMSGKLVIHYYKDRRILDKDCSPADIFTDDIMTSVSKYIALNIARECKKGMNEKARSGWYPAHAPLGYKNIRDGSENKNGRKEAKIVVDDETKKVVLRIFELRAVDGFSYWAIRDKILKEKLLSPKKAKRFSKSSVETILRNPFYEGRYFWNDEWYRGKHEVFVPLEWIRRVDGRRGTSHKNHSVGVFSRLLCCGVSGCGSPIIYDPKIKINKTKGTSRLYHYYHCADGRRVHKLNKIQQVNVGERQLWESLFKPIQEISLTSKMSDFILNHLKQANQMVTESADEVKTRARHRLAQMADKEDELYQHWSGGLLTKDTYTRHLEKLKHERQDIETSLIAVENSDRQEIEDKEISLLELCKDAESKWNELSEEERLALVKRLCSNFYLEGASLRFDLKLPFKKLLELKRNTDNSKWCP
jgi:site-specific DNA recombinase